MGWDPKGAAPNPQTQGTWESHLGESKEPRDRKRDGNTRPVKRNGPKRMEKLNERKRQREADKKRQRGQDPRLKMRL